MKQGEIMDTTYACLTKAATLEMLQCAQVSQAAAFQ